MTAAPGIDQAVVVAGDALVDLAAEHILAKAKRPQSSNTGHQVFLALARRRRLVNDAVILTWCAAHCGRTWNGSSPLWESSHCFGHGAWLVGPAGRLVAGVAWRVYSRLWHVIPVCYDAHKHFRVFAW